MTTNPPVKAVPRERAVLDSAHVGDIKGAFGTIRQHEEGRRGLRSRSLALLAIVGPGLIVMVGDNDAGGVATYSQAGQNYGTSLLWVLALLVPVLIVNQEMVVRLGAVTGVGHARLIIERFGRFWGWFSVGDLFLLNFLTIVTEFIGVSLALGYLGVSKYIAVPLAAAGLIAITVSGSFRFWERSMFIFVFANVLVIPLFLMAHPHIGEVAKHFVIPGIQGGANSTSILLIIGMVGTTVALDQLRAPRHLRRRRDRRARRSRACRRVRVRVRAHPLLRSVHRRGRDRGGARSRARLDRRGVLRDRVAERLADRSGRADAVDQLRVR
jgi:hypothetical protein